jgi:hypothetical protein
MIARSILTILTRSLLSYFQQGEPMATKRDVLVATFPATLRLLNLLAEGSDSASVKAELGEALAEFGGTAIMATADDIPPDRKPCGCLAGSADDEEVFILTARDEKAAQTINLWCALWDSWADFNPVDASPGFRRKILGARSIAERMRDWALRKGTRIPG